MTSRWMPSPSTKNSFKAAPLAGAGNSRSRAGSRGSLRRSSYLSLSLSLSRSRPVPRSRCAISGYGVKQSRILCARNPQDGEESGAGLEGHRRGSNPGTDKEPEIQMIVFPFGVPREVAGKAEGGDENLNQVTNALGSLEPCANFDSTL